MVSRTVVVIRVVLVVLLVRICFIVFVWGVVLRICVVVVVVVVVVFSMVEVVIVGVQRFGTYYINFGADPNIAYIANIHLSLDQMINYSIYAPFKEVHIVLYWFVHVYEYIIILKYAQKSNLYWAG